VRVLPEGLVEDVQRGLEALHDLEPEVPLSTFLIPEEEARAYPGGGSRTLVTQEGDDVALGVVIEPRVQEALSHRDPRERLDRSNLASFCMLIEEVSHCLYLLYCARFERSTTKLELELLGEVDKYLTSLFFLSLQNEGAVSSRLRDWLFKDYRLTEGLTDEEQARYRTASGFADRYCGWLEASFIRPSRLSELPRETSRFYRLPLQEKLARILGLDA
jgi:hypothetical protein